LAVAGTCLLTVLVAWAALIGPDRVFTGPGPTPSTVTTATTESAAERDEVREDAEDMAREADPPVWLKALVWAFTLLVLLALLGLLVLALRVAWEAWRRRPRQAERAPDPGFETLGVDARVESVIRADAAAHDALLDEGTPRNAIVAAWHRFEQQGARAGVRRRPSETSSEFTLRMLDAAGADSRAVTRLGELYREARFSRHEMGEAERAAALEALAAVRESMGRVR
jgi:hypothetical protein